MMLQDHLADIQTRLRAGAYPNEAAISGGIVRRVLDALGWPVYDPHIVYPEYSVQGRRVDFALCHPPDHPRVFVEVKQPGQARGADQQLFEYAFHKGVPMAVMTDGREWHVYVPAGAGSYDERRVYLLDMLERTPAEATERLTRYLAYDRVRTEDAMRAARDDYDRIARSREGERHLPTGWERLLSEPDSALVDLLAVKVETLCGVRPDEARIEAFLRAQSATSDPASRLVQASIREPTPKAMGTLSPNRFSTAPQHHSSRDQANPANANRLSFFELRGDRFESRIAADVFREFFRRLITRAPGFAESFSKQVQGTVRLYLARSPQELLPTMPDKVSNPSYVTEMPEGWFLMTHLSNAMKEQLMKRAGEIARLRYGADFKLHLH